jgi:hypothetical protein
MTWAMMVGVDGGRRRATTWVMMWPVWTMGEDGGDDGGDNGGNNAGKGDGGDTGGEGGGAPGGGRVGGGSDGGGGSCILQGSLLFIVKIFLCGIFL